MGELARGGSVALVVGLVTGDRWQGPGAGVNIPMRPTRLSHRQS